MRQGRNRCVILRGPERARWAAEAGGRGGPGETLRDAHERARFEEGNIRLVEAPTLHGIFYNPAGSRRDHIAVFVVKSFRQETPPAPGREIVEHGFFAPRALPQDTT